MPGPVRANPVAAPDPVGSKPEAPAPENRWAAGRRGEEQALAYLEAKGYRLVARNFRHRRGELDLIVDAPDGTLVFVEVKANRGQSAGRPLERVDGRKVRRLQRLAQRYCALEKQEHRDMRFDVVGVDLAVDGAARIEHLEAAFLPDGAGYWG
jgi:putative endonuclease